MDRQRNVNETESSPCVPYKDDWWTINNFSIPPKFNFHNPKFEKKKKSITL